MSWLLVALISQFIGGSSAIFDKLLIKKSYHNPVGYTFWVGMLAIFSLILLPFGFSIPDSGVLSVALLSGVLFIIGMFFYFTALEKGFVSDVVLLLGALVPIFSLFFSFLILNIDLAFYQIIAFTVLVLGGIFLFISEDGKTRLPIFLFMLAGSAVLGLSAVLTKFVFINSNFVSGFISVKMGEFLFAFLFLAFSFTRKKILHPAQKDVFHNRAAYLVNRAFGGLGSVLFYYALSLGLPPLVDATNNVKFVFVAIIGWLFLRERFHGWKIFYRFLGVALVVAGISWLAVGGLLELNKPDLNRNIVWGATFSQKYAEGLDLDWKKVYRETITDLGVKHLRLVAYWDLVEAEEDKYNFTDLDYQMNLAALYNVDVILAVGQRVPRWPECHSPEWAESAKPNPADPNGFRRKAQSEYSQQLLEYIEEVINRYKDYPNLKYWQVENEPFLKFGECPKLDKDLLEAEIALVHELDNKHNVLTTDGGELGDWHRAAKRGDIFGTTMYRRVYNKVFGQIDYHLPPWYFRLKESVVRFTTGDQNKRFVVIELGAEPWIKEGISDSTIDKQIEFFDLDFFKNTIEYAKKSGFDEYYLWGSEWWYWMKINHSHSEYWEYAKSLF